MIVTPQLINPETLKCVSFQTKNSEISVRKDKWCFKRHKQTDEQSKKINVGVREASQKHQQDSCEGT